MELQSPFKLSLIFLLAVAPTITLAQASDAGPCSFSGYTLGLGLGTTIFMNNAKTNVTLNSVLDPILGLDVGPIGVPNPHQYTNNLKVKSRSFGAMGALFAGYGHVFDNHAYLGAEIGLNILGSNNINASGRAFNTRTEDFDVLVGPIISTRNTNLATTIRATRNAYEPFLDLKLGFLVTPTALIYARGGINYNSYKVSSNTNYNVYSQGSVFDGGFLDGFSESSVTNSLRASHSEGKFGLRLGVGTEILITPKIGVGFDYVYSFYHDLNASKTIATSNVACDAVTGCAIIPATLAGNTKIKLNDQQVMGQLIYHFA